MSEESKSLLLRLKKAKKVNKQIALVQQLKDHNQEKMVNHVLLVHLDRNLMMIKLFHHFHLLLVILMNL